MLGLYHFALMLGALVAGAASLGFGFYFAGRHGPIRSRDLRLGLGMGGAVLAYMLVFALW